MKHNIFIPTSIILAALILTSACKDDNNSSDDIAYSIEKTSEAPDWQIDWSHNQSRPDWQDPDVSAYEFWSVILVQLEKQLQPYASDDDMMAVFVDDELRGLAKPAISMGDTSSNSMFFLIKAFSNEGDKVDIDVTLKYYCSQLHHIFSLSSTIENKVEEVTGVDEDFIPRFSLGPSKYPVVMKLKLDTTPLVSANIQFADGDLIAAFTGDECRGIIPLPATNSPEELFTLEGHELSSLSMTVYGYEDGESLSLKYYDATNSRILTFNNAFKITNNLKNNNEE